MVRELILLVLGIANVNIVRCASTLQYDGVKIIMSNNAEQIAILKKQGVILIVDDDDNIRKPLQRKLTDKGYKCYEATNTEQALE